MIKRLLLTLALFVGLVTTASAATYYIDDAGSDSNDGSSTSLPWKTWTKAFNAASYSGATMCGHTLIVMDGTYTVPTNTKPTVTASCPVGSPFTIQAQNQRAAFVSGDGLGIYEFRILSSAYVVLDGLRIRSTDNVANTASGVVLYVTNSNHIQVKNAIITHNNRYGNTHLLSLQTVSDSLVEGTEFYYFHRHAMFIATGSSNNVVRRNYCNARSYPDILGGYPSGTGTSGDDCYSVYTGAPNNNNVWENNIGEGDTGKHFAVIAADATADNKMYGNIAIGADNFGMSVEGRGSTLATTPQGTLIKDFVSLNAGSSGLEIRGGQGTRCDNCSAIGGASVGFRVDKGQVGQEGLTPRSFYSTGLLALSNTGTGYSHDTTDVSVWTNATSNANSNGTNWSPSSHANYDPDSPSVATPGMASCYLWAPDGSAAQSGGWGATILYRYVDGILTSTPLWGSDDSFPHGAIVAGVNDIDGSSPYNVHERLNVGVANGCAYPASYTGGGSEPSNPATYTNFEATAGGTIGTVTIPSGMDYVGVCVALIDSAFNVGSVTSITIGGEALTLVGTQPVASPTFRRAILGYKLAPTSGASRSVVVNTTGNVTGLLAVVMQHDDISDVNIASTNLGSGTVISTTGLTNTSELVTDCLATGKTYDILEGAAQTIQRSDDHSTQLLRLTTSTQAGDDDGVMSYTNSGSTAWAHIVLSLLPTSPDPPPSPTPTLTQTKFLWRALRGSESAAQAWPYTGATSINMVTHVTGAARLRIEIKATDNASTPTGLVLFCSKNGGAYSIVNNTAGTHGVRLYGAGTDPDIPSSSTATTQLLSSGDFVGGVILRDAASVYTTGTLAVDDLTELEWALVFSESAGDYVECRVYDDSGTAIDAYTVTPRMNFVGVSTGMGF